MSAKNAKKKKKRKVAKGLDKQSMGPKRRGEVGNDEAKLLRSIEIQRLTPGGVVGWGLPALCLDQPFEVLWRRPFSPERGSAQ